MGVQCSVCDVGQNGADEVAIAFNVTESDKASSAVPQCALDPLEDVSVVHPKHVDSLQCLSTDATEEAHLAALRQSSDWISSSSTAASLNSLSDHASAEATESSQDLSHSMRDSFSSLGAQLTVRSDVSSSLEEPETEAEAHPTTELPNFRGTWVMTGIDGDYGLFMADTGESQPSPRQLANGFDYGMGTRIQEITQEGDRITIANVTALGPHLITSDHPMSFRIGGGLTKTIGLDGVKIIVSADMHGDVLVMHCRRRSKQAPEGTYTFRRYLEGDKMVVEVEIDEDKTARRVFVQKSK